MQSSTYNNFLVEEIGVRPEQLGILESIRETPGFLTAFISGLTVKLAQPVLAGISLLLVGLGIGNYVHVYHLLPLIYWSLVWSTGLHSWMAILPSMSLSLSEKGRAGRRLGQISATAALATVSGLGLVYLLSLRIGYRLIFLLAGIIIIAGAATVINISRSITPAVRPRFVLRRKYRLYYWLTFLEGCRKQVFITFALFTLVKIFHLRVRDIAILMIINSLVNFFAAPWIGRGIDIWGERKILTLNYTGLIFIFLGYALIPRVTILCSLYLLDNFFFLFSMALTTYLHKIASPEDIAPTLAMGVTMNHVAAVIVPVSGGLIWKAFGYQAAFLGGALVVLISLLVAQKVRPLTVSPISKAKDKDFPVLSSDVEEIGHSEPHLSPGDHKKGSQSSSNEPQSPH